MVALAAALLASGAHAAPGAAGDDGGTVVVWKRIATTSDPLSVSKEMEHALPAWAATRGSASLSAFTARLYRLSPRWHPGLIAAIGDKIAAMNGIDPVARLPANRTFTVPFVPGIGGALSGAARSSAFLSVDLRTPAQVEASVGPMLDGLVRNLGRATAGFAIAIRQMSVGQALRELVADPDLGIMSAPLQLKQAAASRPSPYRPSDADLAILHQVALLPTTQHPLVVIADSVAPDRIAEQTSRAVVLAAIGGIRSRAGLPPVLLSDASCSPELADASWTDPPLDDGNPVHSIDIGSSLSDLVASAGPGAWPRVVFIPLLRGSKCQAELLRQLVELHYLMTQVARSGAQGSDPAVVGAYRKQASKTVGKVAASERGGFVHTDTEVVQAILNFASFYADAKGEPVFTSMSWTFVPDGSFNPRTPKVPGGLYVVAAGNEGRLSTAEVDRIEFPARALRDADTLAVMNVGADGRLLCDSSVVGKTGHPFATSFNGAIPGGCGTSFSAPRVAWLLAFRESVRSPVVAPASLAAVLRRDASIGGPMNSEGGGRVLDIATLFRDQIAQSTSVPAAPAAVTDTPVPRPVDTSVSARAPQ